MSLDVITVDGARIVVREGVDVVAGLVGPQGVAGQDAFAGASFSWTGFTLAGEPPQGQVMPSAGAFVAANCCGGAAVAATANTVFVISINGVGAGTVAFPPGQVTPEFSLSAASYPAGAYVQAAPPATPDVTLQGPAFVLSN